MVFQVQGAEKYPATAVVQFHQGRIGQIEFAFQQGAPATAVRLLDGGAADTAAVAPVPTGVRLVSLVAPEVIAHILRIRFDEGAAARPVAKVLRLKYGEGRMADGGRNGEDAPGYFWTHAPLKSPGQPVRVLHADQSPAPGFDEGFEPGR